MLRLTHIIFDMDASLSKRINRRWPLMPQGTQGAFLSPNISGLAVVQNRSARVDQGRANNPVCLVPHSLARRLFVNF